jgi:hypothetical protein
MTKHPLILGLFNTTSAAATAARELRTLGIPQQRVSIVARSHDEEGDLARATGASPGSEIEDSRPAGRLGELSAHFFAAVAIALPGIGPIVADGPLAAGLGEAAGHVAGGIARALQNAGLPHVEAEQWETRIERGAILVGAHTDASNAGAAKEILARSGAAAVAEGAWRD